MLDRGGEYIGDSEHRDARSHLTADAVARRSYGKLVAYLAARTADLAAAEDALSEAFASALEDWPRNGCPTNPEGWLLTVARRKQIDAVRRRIHAEAATDTLELIAQRQAVAEQQDIPDRRLALMFVCAHPAIDVGIRAPLMLQVVLGLNAKRIASAFLTSPATIGKRLVRAKDKIRHAGIPFRIPDRNELAGRLGTVLDAIYAAFSEGWSDPVGFDASRRDLAEEALFLARIVVDLMPDEPEALGLTALLLHADARRQARRGLNGEYVPLADQDTDLWDAGKVFEAESLLRRASTHGLIGRYQLEAALQSAHVYRCRTGFENWHDVVGLYDALLALAGSPVVAINRALAIGEMRGPVAALAALEDVAGDKRLAEYQPYWAARAELLAKSGSIEEARRSYDVAIGLESDPAVRRFLLRRQTRLGSSDPPA